MTITFKILGSILIIFATFIATVVIIGIEKQISNAEEEITNFHDSRILTMMGILSYEGRDILLAVQDVQYNQLNYLLELKQEISDKEKHKEELSKLEKITQETQEIILHNNIFLAILWSTLLSENELDKSKTKEAADKIRTDKNLTMTQKIEKIREIQNENQKVFGGRLAKIQEKWLENLDIKKRLDKTKSFWHGFFMWMQIGGLSMLAIAEAIEGIIEIKKKSKSPTE